MRSSQSILINSNNLGPLLPLSGYGQYLKITAVNDELIIAREVKHVWSVVLLMQRH